MKIAIFTQRMDGRATGTALYTRKLVENLLEIAQTNGDEIFLVHRMKTNDPIYKKAREIIIPKVSLPRFSYFFSEAIFLWKTRNEFDLIHYPEESIYPLFWLSRAKVIITAHSGVEGWRDFGILRRRWWLIYITFKFFKNRLSKIICVSYSTKKSIQKFFNISEDKFLVVYLGINESFKKPIEAWSKDTARKFGFKSPYILAFGRIDPHKNIPRAIEAFYKIKKERNISHSLVVGSHHWGPENEKVDNLIKMLGIEKEVFFLKYVSDEDLPTLFSGADIMVFPSLHEGFGIPVLEAMAVGTPVITSNVFALPEIAGGAAHLINPYSVDEIAQGIWKVLSNQNYRHELVQKGIARSSEFNWDKMAEETIKILKDNNIKIKKCLTFRASSIGDCLMGKYFLENIRAAYPDAKCGILVGGKGGMIRELLVSYPWIEVVEANRRNPISLLRAFWKFRGSDLALTQYAENPFSAPSKIFARLVTKKNGLLGFEDGSGLNKFLYDKIVPYAGEKTKKAIFSYEKDALRMAGFSILVPELKFKILEDEKVLKKFGLEKERYLILQLFAGNEGRGIPMEKRKKIAEVLIKNFEQKYKIVFTGSKQDRALFQDLGVKGGIIAAGETTINEFLNLINLSRAVLSLDTGAAHIAAQLTKPLVVLTRLAARYSWWADDQYKYEKLKVLLNDSSGDEIIRNINLVL